MRPGGDPTAFDTHDGDDRQTHERREALSILMEARERLLSQLSRDILSNRDAILDGSANDGLFGFEFQELEERYSARLHALNSILENLEYRQPHIVNRIETFASTRGTLSKDLNDIVRQHDQWDIVDINVTPLEEEKLLVVVGFTADEYEE